IPPGRCAVIPPRNAGGSSNRSWRPGMPARCHSMSTRPARAAHPTGRRKAAPCWPEPPPNGTRYGRLILAWPVDDGTVPDVEHEHYVLRLVDLVQHPPVVSQPGAVDPGGLFAKTHAASSWVVKQPTGN